MKARLGNVEVQYDLEGREGAPVVMCSHCLAANRELWMRQLPDLAKQYRVLRYDIRGHGGSSAPDEDYTMEQLAEDAVKLLDRLEIPSVHFMGISLGGMIGQVLGAEHPHRVKSLVLCDTACRVDPELKPVWKERVETARSEGMDALVQPTLERWLSDGFRREAPGITSQIEQMIRETPVAGFAGCCEAISGFDALDRLSRIAAPTLVMVGEDDPGTPVSEAETIARNISGSELAVIPDARHLSNVEAYRAFNERLLAFLQGAQRA